MPDGGFRRGEKAVTRLPPALPQPHGVVLSPVNLWVLAAMLAFVAAGLRGSGPAFLCGTNDIKDRTCARPPRKSQVGTKEQFALIRSQQRTSVLKGISACRPPWSPPAPQCTLRADNPSKDVRNHQRLAHRNPDSSPAGPGPARSPILKPPLSSNATSGSKR